MKQYTLTILAIVVFIYLTPSAFAGDRRPDKTKLKFLSFNTYFMWDGIGEEEGAKICFPWKFSKKKADQHMKDIADVIKRNTPDMILLVEIEGVGALNRLNNKYLEGQGYKSYFIQGKDGATGQDVGLLTRVDPVNNKIERYSGKGVSGNEKKGVSKNLFAKFHIGDFRLAIIGLHFLAHPNSNDRYPKRQAQASAIRDLAISLNGKGYEIIVAGDFNDYDNECKDHINSEAKSNVLQTIKRMTQGVKDDDLMNAACLMPKQTRYTSYYDKNDDGRIDVPNEYTSIDHILLSNGLYANVNWTYIDHRVDSVNVSDHFPVVVEFKIGN